MNRILLIVFLLCFVFSCKSKKPGSDVPVANFFVSDYIKGQVAMLDTLHASFTKLETTNGMTDTASITNAQAKNYANDFLTLPDIASADLRDDYSLDHLYDEIQEAFVFTYTTKEAHPVQREDVTVEPQMNAKGTNDIRSMYADLWITDKEKTVRKNLLWEANKSFLINTSTEGPGAAQSVKSIKVVWNGFNSQNK